MEKIIFCVVGAVCFFGMLVSTFPQLKALFVSCPKCEKMTLKHHKMNGYGDNIFKCETCGAETSIGAGG